ncbi:MAG: glycosyltransferase [Proteobacteria bacterium]|nr:glycosyltransferase [Pseudomonadota bacterium]
MSARIFIHVQHLLGVGHLRRAAVIAAALCEAGFAVELVSGGMPVAGLAAGAARMTQLPPARAADATFKTIIDEAGRLIDDAWKERRRALLLGRFHAVAPDVVITEHFPFGRRAFDFELLPLLAAAREARALSLASVRDVVVVPTDPRKIETTVTRVHQCYDRVLVHGDPTLIAFGASFPAAGRLGDRLVYTGYVTTPAPAPPAGDGEDEVIVSAGGGAVGARLLETALAARPLTALRDKVWRFLLGGNLPTGVAERLAASARAGIIVQAARPDFPNLLPRCCVSVSQAGYNTVMDLLTAAARAVLVPFAQGGETEQSQRAAALAAQGWARVVREAELAPAALAAAIDRAAAAPRPACRLRFDGAGETARLIRHWQAAREGHT